MEELTQDGAQLARTLLMSAAQLAESMARVQAQRAWMAQHRSATRAGQAQAQVTAERDAARLIFRPLTDGRYWQDAPQLDRVVQGYMTAASWAEHDPEAKAALQLIKQHAEASWRREAAVTTRSERTPDMSFTNHQVVDGRALAASGAQFGREKFADLPLSRCFPYGSVKQ